MHRINRLDWKLEVTHPVVVPLPLEISTLMSQTRSPEVGSHFTLHQFLRPMMYLLLGADPSVSLSNIGICIIDIDDRDQ